MDHIPLETRKVNAHFDISSGQQPSIEFADPVYVAADAVLFDPDYHTVHLVLHEGLYLVGVAPDNLVNKFKKSDSVKLHASYHAGDDISLCAPISVVEH